MTKEQKEALRKFAETMGDENYEERKGFFGKVFRFRTAPAPRHSLQGWWMIFPLPPQREQGEEVAKTPMVPPSTAR